MGFWWNSQTQQWERNDQLANPPSELIRIRVWSATEQVDQVAAIVVEALQPYGISRLEQSEAYIYRPPKQKESRIYLTFKSE